MNNKQKIKTAILMAHYKEDFKVVSKTLKNIFDKSDFIVYICDDGTPYSTLQADIKAEFKSELRSKKLLFFENKRNKGQGFALRKLAKQAYKDPALEYFVTFDSDGQHRIVDAKKMVEKAHKEGLECVLGSRFYNKLDSENIQLARKALLVSATFFMRYILRYKITDPQNGLRVFNREGVRKILTKMRADRYAHANEILEMLHKRGILFEELPVKIIYSKYSVEKGQSNLNVINVIFELVILKIGSYRRWGKEFLYQHNFLMRTKPEAVYKPQ